ncbi:MAG: twin-arginine translocase subunit TatC [Alphaproteobacteria bacterium]|nr:twin-arginine translocase subunit TatC [Alphaproteobacteria bacterium]
MNEPQSELMEAPLLAHFAELRRRVVLCAGLFLALFCAAYFYAEDIYQFLLVPLADVLKGEDRRLIYTALTEAFMTYMKVSFFAALFLTFPIMANQIYRFIAPGLYKHEKQLVMPFFVAVPALFFMGAAFAYYVLIPFAWKFFVGFETLGGSGHLAIQLEARISDYLDLVMQLVMAFGVAFQMPVLLVALIAAGLISSQSLAKKRRIAIVIIFIIGAILTPPDVLSQISLSLPLCFLYECSIWTGKLIERRKLRYARHSVDT